jgi:hypothetical protein
VIGRRPRQRYFDREFNVALWRGFQALGAGTRRLVLAVLLVGAAYAVSGGSRVVLYGTVALAAIALLLLREAKRPSPNGLGSSEELQRPIDALQAGNEDGRSTDGNGQVELGDLCYEEALGELLRFVGREVTVIVSATSDGWSAATMGGVLRGGISVGRDSDEVLLFALDDEWHGFFVARDRFRYATPVSRDESAGLGLYIGDAVVWVVDEGSPRPRRMLNRGRGRRP